MTVATPDFSMACMREALSLAAQGIGTVEPNPPVGAVVVARDGTIVGRGWHQRFGGPHAEVNALAEAGPRAAGGTLYVTLEPCCHFGKTPPCSAAVIASGVAKVVIGTTDPNPRVSGGGIRALEAAGIAVEQGLLATEAAALIAPFVERIVHGRCWVHAKWAMTLDGKLAAASGHSQWITNPASRAIAHQLRGRMEAILVGIGTVLADDPLLTARPRGPRRAVRVVLDSHGRLPVTSQLARTTAEAPVLWCVGPDVAEAILARLVELGVTVLRCPSDADGRVALPFVLEELSRQGLTHVLIEGGQQLLGSAFDAGLVRECHAFIAPKVVGGSAAPSPVGGRGKAVIPETASLLDPTIELVDGDIYVHGRWRS